MINIVDGSTETDPVTVQYSSTGCPMETYPEYRVRYSIDAGSLGPWSTWSTTPETTVSMWMGQQLLVQVQVRCISDWTPAAPGTEGPSATTVNPPWVRPIDAPVAPVATSDAGGTSQAKNDRVLWNTVACPTNTTVRFRPDLVNVPGTWQTTTRFNVPAGYGTTYDYQVVAECVSSYGQSPDAKSNHVIWTTNVPTPSTPWITVSGPAFTDEWFSISAGGSTCPAGTNTYYEFSDDWGGSLPPDGTVAGTGNYNGSDYWSSPGVVTYEVKIACAGPNATGAFSPPASDWITIKPPVPGYPGGPIAYGVGSGCPYPGSYTPQVGVGFRINAWNGLCYYQTQQPVRNGFGFPTGAWYPWSPADPGIYYNASYSG